MAIEQQQFMMEHNFQSVSDDTIRNAPTPPMVKNEHSELLDMDFSFANTNFDDFGPFSGNQTITFSQQYSPSSEPIYTDNISFPSSSFPTMPQTNQFTASFASSSHSFANDIPSGRDSVVSISSKSIKSNKEKCMSRNAIAARENRTKKKQEMDVLRKEVGKLQEETATIKKKYIQLKDQCKVAQERNQYYESILTNLPSIMDIIEHMKNIPKDENSKRLKKKFNNINLTNNNLGVCFHVKTSQEMTLKFCDYCANGTSVPKKKNTET